MRIVVSEGAVHLEEPLVEGMLRRPDAYSYDVLVASPHSVRLAPDEQDVETTWNALRHLKSLRW